MWLRITRLQPSFLVFVSATIPEPSTLTQIFLIDILRWTRVGASFRVIASCCHVAEASGSRRFSPTLTSTTFDDLVALRRCT
jgi:hypothetical protein